MPKLKLYKITKQGDTLKQVVIARAASKKAALVMFEAYPTKFEFGNTTISRIKCKGKASIILDKITKVS